MNTVLIVEDEILEQEFLKTIVHDQLLPEDKVLVCGSGIQAIQLAKQYRPNIIIMDLMISEIDGLTAIQEIRKFLPNTCITIISAYSDFSYAQKAINLKVFEYLLKPVKPRIFKEIFQKMLEVGSNSDDLALGRFEQNKINNEDEERCFINEAIKYMKEHFKEKLTLEMIASKAFMHPKYFSRVFKNEIGVTFTEYIIQLRIQHACRLLETTNYPAYRVSLECGFSDPSYFNRVFRAQVGMTPQTYRRSISSKK